MASWKEIERIRKSPAEARSVAKGLLRYKSRELTVWETAFLESMCSPYREELSTLQVEKLLEVRDGVEFVTEHRRFSVKSLIEGVYVGRTDLSETDEEWIVKVRERSRESILRKYGSRLMALARQLNVIEDEAA